MTKVTINPGVCGLITRVQAQSEDQIEVKVTVESDCQGISKLFEAIGDTFDAFEVCLSAPVKNPLYQAAVDYLPGHAACPVLAGIIKCMEAECRLALPRDAGIHFETEESN